MCTGHVLCVGLELRKYDDHSVLVKMFTKKKLLEIFCQAIKQPQGIAGVKLCAALRQQGIIAQSLIL